MENAIFVIAILLCNAPAEPGRDPVAPPDVGGGLGRYVGKIGGGYG